MTGWLYITFAVIIGIGLLNICICRYFHQKMKMLKYNKTQLKFFDIISLILGILPPILLLPFSFWLNGIWLIYFAMSVALFCVFLSYFDYQINFRDAQCFVWWHKMSKFDKSILLIMIILTVCLCFYNHSFLSIFRLMCFNAFFVYVFWLKKMREQQKISYLFSGKYKKFGVKIISSLFYYAAWLVIGIYVASMSINVISLYFDPYDTDGCIDTGICKDGFTFNDCGNGIPCTITKENCLKNNNIWFEDIHSCDIRHYNH